MFKSYAGIGSRDTPDDILELMYEISKYLDKHGWTLNSGGARGADTAFEAGSSKSQIFLPYNGFNNHYIEDNVKYIVPDLKASDSFVEDYHPYGYKLTGRTRQLISRNTYQVLGKDLKTPVQFIVCWTPFGHGGGGTGQALRIAPDYGVKIFDLGNTFTYNNIYDKINVFVTANQ